MIAVWLTALGRYIRRRFDAAAAGRSNATVPVRTLCEPMEPLTDAEASAFAGKMSPSGTITWNAVLSLATLVTPEFRMATST